MRRIFSLDGMRVVVFFDGSTYRSIYRSIYSSLNQAMGNLAIRLLPWLLLCHLGFSTWFYGNPTLLQSDVISFASFSRALTDSLTSANITQAELDQAGVDPMVFLQGTIENQIKASDGFHAWCMGHLLMAYLKIIRVNTLPVFLCFVLLLMMLILYNIVRPMVKAILKPFLCLYNMTFGALWKVLVALFKCVRSIAIRPVTVTTGNDHDDKRTYPEFTGAFERFVGHTVATTYNVDAAKGFEVDDRGMLLRRWIETVEIDGLVREKGARMRTWEAISAPVKTYAIEDNPKYKVGRTTR